MEGGALLALRRGRNTPNDTKRSGREVRQPGGLSDRGEPYQGVPRRTQSCTTTHERKPRQQGKRTTFRLADAVFLWTFSTPKILRALSSVAAQPVARLIKLDAKKTAAAAWERRHAAAGAVLRFGLVRSASCRNFEKIAAAGTSAGGLRAAFFLFWVAPEAQRDWISLSAESEEGALPLPSLPAFFQKAGPKT